MFLQCCSSVTGKMSTDFLKHHFRYVNYQVSLSINCLIKCLSRLSDSYGLLNKPNLKAESNQSVVSSVIPSQQHMFQGGAESPLNAFKIFSSDVCF